MSPSSVNARNMFYKYVDIVWCRDYDDLRRRTYSTLMLLLGLQVQIPPKEKGYVRKYISSTGIKSKSVFSSRILDFPK